MRIFEIVSVARPGDRASRVFDACIASLIVLNVVAIVLESVPEVYAEWRGVFELIEHVSVLVFTVEYILRIWSCVEDPRFRAGLRGRFRFSVTPLAVIDLAAILPYFLPFLGVDMRFARILRLFRLARAAKLVRYTEAIDVILRVIKDRKHELLVSLAFMFVLILIAASLLYFAESESQPEHFASIPAAMWWAVVTLTTVGYGDIYPITPLGRVLSGSIAILGVGMVALPTSILGSGFVDELSRRRTARSICPHCGGDLEVRK